MYNLQASCSLVQTCSAMQPTCWIIFLSEVSVQIVLGHPLDPVNPQAGHIDAQSKSARAVARPVGIIRVKR
jgi:hypothetical protein